MSENKNETQEKQLSQDIIPEEADKDTAVVEENLGNPEAESTIEDRENSIAFNEFASSDSNKEEAPDEDEEEDEDSAENKKELHPIFKKLAELSPKHAKIFQIVYGLFCGIVCYAILLLEYFFPRMDKLLVYGCYGLVALIIFFSFNMGKKTGWDMIPYRMGLIIGIASGIVANLIYLWVTTGKIF